MQLSVIICFYFIPVKNDNNGCRQNDNTPNDGNSSVLCDSGIMILLSYVLKTSIQHRKHGNTVVKPLFYWRILLKICNDKSK